MKCGVKHECIWSMCVEQKGPKERNCKCKGPEAGGIRMLEE